jgi:hypothetical protein
LFGNIALIAMSWFTKKHTPPKIPSIWPSFVDGKEPIRRWTHPDGKRRVFLIARRDGMFGRWSEYFSEEEFEMCWVPDDRGGSFYDSQDAAVSEIHSAYPWAAAVRPEYPEDTK